MINNKLVFGIGTMLVLITTLSLNIPSKIAIAQQQQQQQGEETSMMPMDKMMQNMTEEQLSKKIMQTLMDEIKKENPIHADMIDKIPSMNLEETVKNLFAIEYMEQLLKMHADDLIEGKSMGSNQTTTTK
jgi:hypothetical protein